VFSDYSVKIETFFHFSPLSPTFVEKSDFYTFAHFPQTGLFIWPSSLFFEPNATFVKSGV
jgi:hypothetical protein